MSQSFRIPRRMALCVLLALALPGAFATEKFMRDHSEFEAALHVPFLAGRGVNEAREFSLHFDYPRVATEQAVLWRVDLLSPTGRVLQQWYGIDKLNQQPVQTKISWAGRNSHAGLADGVYQVRLQARALDAALVTRRAGLPNAQVEEILAGAPAEVITQSWPFQLGAPGAVSMPAFQALAGGANTRVANNSTNGLARPATGSLPYTVYLGNLHSQSNHSDGGGDIATCASSLPAQSGTFGPADAFTYAQGKGLDFLMVSEHNHYFDGSSATNASANPTTAKSKYQSGLAAASSFNSTHPGFLAQYGLEWGVISNGGHLNIFGSKELLAWEYNSSNQLIGDTFVAKGDYAALYTLMRQRGWVGQFNHPSDTTQFKINNVDFGYTADGDQVMTMCEAMDTDAFSHNTTETETVMMMYESACNKILEAGFHVALTTNQDNHCANWGSAATNRTALLIPNGVALNEASFTEALKARRMFATMDKNSQLILTANGHIMGERFTNSGPLNLVANFANSAGRSVAAVAIMEGVPGRRGTVTQLASSATTSFTPGTGEHFYYAKITQDDGKILWSAPVWVTQTGGGGTTPTELIVNGGFEAGTSPWVATSGVIGSTVTATPSRTGSARAKLDGYGTTHTDSLYQQVTIPATATSANLSVWLRVLSLSTSTTTAYDTLKVQVRNSSNAVLATLATYSNLNKGTSYLNKTFDLSAYKGQTVRIYFEGIEDIQVSTTFLIDDVSLLVK